MTDIDSGEPETDEGDVPPPDPGISLSVRVPFVLDPRHRQRDGMVMIAWATDSGETLCFRRIEAEEFGADDCTDLFWQKLERRVPCILVVLYDGDDGRLVSATTVKPPDDDESDKDDAVSRLLAVLGEAAGDPDRPCAICDDTVPEGADIDRTRVHRECLLANLIGPLGHHMDHAFWYENVGDPHCGRGARQAALDLDALVEKHGLRAVLDGDFPKDAPIGNEETDA